MESTLSRRERERMLRRKEMLQAARAVFAEKGYTHATLEEIAQRAEFGKGTLYNYFEGKEDILLAIFDELYDDLCQHVSTSFLNGNIEQESIREGFRRFLNTTFTFFLERQDVFLLIMKVAHRMTFSENAEQAKYFKQQQDRIIDILVQRIETAIEHGQMRRLSPRSVAHMLIGNINGFLMHLSLDAKGESCSSTDIPTPQEAADFLTTVLLDGLLARNEVSTSNNNH